MAMKNRRGFAILPALGILWIIGAVLKLGIYIGTGKSCQYVQAAPARSITLAAVPEYRRPS